MGELQIENISGVDCYEKDGTVYLKLESVARGLGFTETAASGNECIRWRTVRKYLSELGIATTCDGEKLPDFIPENIFYRLAMKAKNETAERFQAKVADEIIPSIRKHGAYMTPGILERALASPDFLIQLATKLKDEQERNKEFCADETAHHKMVGGQAQMGLAKPLTTKWWSVQNWIVLQINIYLGYARLI